MSSSNSILPSGWARVLLVGTILGGWSAPAWRRNARPDASRPAAAPAGRAAPLRHAAGRLPAAWRGRRAASSARSRCAAASASSRKRSSPMRTSSPGQTYTAETLDQALKDLYATELFADVVITGADTGNLVITVRENPVINRIVLEGNKRIKDDKITPGDQARAAPDLHPFEGPRRRRPDHRALPPPGPLRRHGRAEDRPARPEPRRPGLRDHEGDKSKVRAINIIGNEQYSRRPAAQGDVHARRPAAPRLLQVERQLRSRPPRRRPAEAARLLPDRGLCRLPRRLRRWPS